MLTELYATISLAQRTLDCGNVSGDCWTKGHRVSVYAA